MKLPEVLKRGPKWMREWSRDVREAIQAGWPLRSETCEIHETPSGAQVIPRAASAQQGGGTTAKEFAVYTFKAGSTKMVGVRPGAVTCYAYDTGVFPWPDNFTAENDYKCEFPVTEDGVVWIAVTNDVSGNQDKVTGITIGNGSALPAFDPTVGTLALAYWYIDADDNVIFGGGETGIGNQYYYQCGGAHLFTPA